MKKGKILILLMVAILITGCENKKVIESKVKTTTTVTMEDIEINLSSDDSRKVYVDGNKYLVYYFQGNDIVGYEVYLDYETSNKAAEALETYDKLGTDESIKDSLLESYKNDINIENTLTNGKYLVFIYNSSVYESLTLNKVISDNANLKEKTN